MHGNGYETRQVPLFGVFGLDPAQNTPFFDTMTNQILRLSYARLIWEPMRDQKKRLCRVTVNSTSILFINGGQFIILLSKCKLAYQASIPYRELKRILALK